MFSHDYRLLETIAFRYYIKYMCVNKLNISTTSSNLWICPSLSSVNKHNNI